MPNTPTAEEMNALRDYLAGWVLVISLLACCIAACGAREFWGDRRAKAGPTSTSTTKKEDDKPNEEQE